MIEGTTKKLVKRVRLTRLYEVLKEMLGLGDA